MEIQFPRLESLRVSQVSINTDFVIQELVDDDDFVGIEDWQQGVDDGTNLISLTQRICWKRKLWTQLT